MNQDFLSIFKSINLSSIMSGANKTLGVIKKTIPVYREVKPYLLREKSIFSKKKTTDVVDEIKESNPIKDENRSVSYNDTLTFFQ